MTTVGAKPTDGIETGDGEKMLAVTWEVARRGWEVVNDRGFDDASKAGRPPDCGRSPRDWDARGEAVTMSGPLRL